MGGTIVSGFSIKIDWYSLTPVQIIVETRFFECHLMKILGVICLTMLTFLFETMLTFLFETRENAWIVRPQETTASLECDRGDTNSFEFSLVA
jgi:hypothetical protein